MVVEPDSVSCSPAPLINHGWRTAAIRWDLWNGPAFTFHGTGWKTSKLKNLWVLINPLHRIEFCPPKFFSKTFRFSMIFYSTSQIVWGGHFRKACRFRPKKNRNSRKSHANSWNLLEPFLRSRKEENLYGHCPINNARRILSKSCTLLRSCCFWSKKLQFSKEFWSEF